MLEGDLGRFESDTRLHPETDEEAFERIARESTLEEQREIDARNARYKRNSTDEFVVTILVGERVPETVIARAINKPWGLKIETMQRHYGVELAAGRSRLLALAYSRMLRDIGTSKDNPGTNEGTRAAMFLINRLGGLIQDRNTGSQPSPNAEGVLNSPAAGEEVVFTFKAHQGIEWVNPMVDAA